jgi:hypothetical protein
MFSVIIEEELKDVRELIHLNEELLSEFPDDNDSALEFNLNYLKGLETDLINDRNHTYTVLIEVIDSSYLDDCKPYED